jgi:putative ABC transport system substrate-binding protein
MIFRIQRFKIFIIIFGLCLWTSISLAESPVSILILRSKDIAPYNNALYGFKEGMDKQLMAIYDDYNLDDFAGRLEPLIEEIEKRKPQLIFVIGTEAAIFAKEHIKDVPIIFSMVLNPIESGIVPSRQEASENITGISLKISVEQQFQKLKEAIPNIQKVGMLYDAKNMVELKEEAEKAASKLGLELVAKPIYSKNDIDGALNDVVREADVLWAGVDTLIYNPQSAQHILLTTLRNKIPFMAFSSNYVNAGALMALECDYTDIGRQASELASKILGGEKVNEIPVHFPRTTRLIVNEKTAQLIGVKLPKVYLQ